MMKTPQLTSILETAPEANLNALKFLQLLIDVSRRIETSQPKACDVSSAGFIDKLEFEILISLDESQLIHNAKSKGFPGATTRLNNGQWHQKISAVDNSWAFYFKKNYTLKTVTQILTNPSNFKSLNDYVLTLKSLIYPLTLADIKITRIDLTCDYEIHFDSFIQCLDIKNQEKEKKKKDHVKKESKRL